MTTDAKYQIFDTRAPEGDGGPMRDELGVLQFDNHHAACSWLALKGLDPARMIISLADALTYCEGCETEDAPLNDAGYCPACVFAAKRSR